MRNQRRKKELIILTVIAIVTSAVAFGVVTFLNSPKMKLASIIQKIPKIESGEGTYIIDAKMQIAEADINIGINDGVLKLTRKYEKNQSDVDNFLYAKGTVYASANKESKLRLASKYINGESGEWLLNNQYIFKSSFLNQQIEYKTDDIFKNMLSKIFFVPSGSGGESEENLQSFLFKGYEPTIIEEKHRAGIIFTKLEIKKIIQKMEENVQGDYNKFITLAKKQYAHVPVSKIEILANQLKNKEISKNVEENIFSKVQEFYFKMMFEEKETNTVTITTELKMNGSAAMFDYNVSGNLFFQTTMNYKVST